MDLHLLIQLIFLIFSIFLIALSVVIFSKASHLKGQRFVTVMLFVFGAAYLTEVIIYLLPIKYTYFLQVWVGNTLTIVALSILTHFLMFLIQKHTIINLRFMPYAFYGLLAFYLIFIGPLELFFGENSYVQKEGWYIKEALSPASFSYFIVPLLLCQVLLIMLKGLKYAPSEKRKRLYTNYLSGSIVAFALSIISLVFLIAPVFSIDVAILISFMPMLTILGIENYLYSPGITKHYDKIIELSPVALVVLNRDFEIVEINARAKQWFDMEVNEQLLDSLQSFENIQAFMQFLTDLQSSQEVDDYRITLDFEKKVHFSISASIVLLDDEYYYYIIFRDITNEYEQEQKNYYLAYHDALTTLYNRTFFTSYVYEKLKSFAPPKKGAIILSDLNFFKRINDTYGHHIGDEVLIHTGKLISSKISTPNVVARLGGDEFIVYLDEIESEESLKEKIASIRELFNKTPYVKDDIVIEVIPSFGYAIITEGLHYEELYQKADGAMYEDKHRIKAKYAAENQFVDMR